MTKRSEGILIGREYRFDPFDAYSFRIENRNHERCGFDCVYGENCTPMFLSDEYLAEHSIYLVEKNER